MRAARRPGRSGVTLIEVLLAMTLLSLLSVGMAVAMRVGLSALAKTDTKLMANRRVAGAQRILESELEGMIPVRAPCGLVTGGAPIGFFQGDPAAMRLVSTFSLEEGARGRPQILEIFVIPGESGGVRLVVNEIPYSGPLSAGRFCTGIGGDPMTGQPAPSFSPVSAGPKSFVLADQLAYCRFSYYSRPLPTVAASWRGKWGFNGWPAGIRVEMAPREPDPSRVQPISIVVPVRLHRGPDINYVDD
jgi:prepilin-type N-terminal cleavage/methylation domain-containing protein